MALSGYSLNALALLVARAMMSSTYKPALLRALNALAQKYSESVPLTEVALAFAHLYWEQTLRYGLRQGTRTDGGEPEVVQFIRDFSKISGVRDYHRLPPDARDKLAQRVAKIIQTDVLWRFHKSKPPSMPDLYVYRRGDATLRFLPGAAEFLQRRRKAVDVIANYAWAQRLEQWNRLAPRVIDKVEGKLRPRSDVRSKYLQILLSIDPHCFYCDMPLHPDSTHLDHVISWNYMLDDRVWDLVPACAPCNQAKSNRLPPLRFIEKLIARNAGRLKGLVVAADMHDADELPKLYDGAKAMEWPVWEGS